MPQANPLRRHYLLLTQKLKSQKPSKLPNALGNSSSGNANMQGTPSEASSLDHPGFNKTGLKRVLSLAVVAALGALFFQYVEETQEKSLRMLQANRLKNIGLAIRVNAQGPGMKPNSIAALMNNGAIDASNLLDPVSGKPFVLLGGEETQPQKAIAYSPWVEGKGGACLFADGSVQSLAPERYKAMIQSSAPFNAATPNGN
jgi:hypothetical protein